MTPARRMRLILTQTLVAPGRGDLDFLLQQGIDQGFFRQRDYRDDLAEMIRRKFPSRYRFAKRVGIDEALLSRVIRKKAHLSIDKLESAVAPLGYRVALIRSSGRVAARARAIGTE